MDLSTTCAGLTLKNPIIVGSCPLTRTVAQLKACEDAGAGAVVMKSLFEEEIREAEAALADEVNVHPEVMDYLRADIGMRYGADEYTATIEQAKQTLTIPVIASVNCYSAKWWPTYAQKIEAAGADALELNVFIMPFDFSKTAAEIEDVYIEIVKQVKAQVKIPIFLKVSPFFTSFGNFAARLEEYDLNGLVMFSRFVQTDINITDLTATLNPSFHDPVGFHRALRWTAMLSDMYQFDVIASGGIRDEAGVIKQILAGAAAVQMVSVFYAQGVEKIQQILRGLETWMQEQDFQSVADFKGRLNRLHATHDEAFTRSQYLKFFSGMVSLPE